MDIPASMLVGSPVLGGTEPPAAPRKAFSFDRTSSRVNGVTITLPPRVEAPATSLVDAGAQPLHLEGRAVSLRIEVSRSGGRVVGVDLASGRVLEPHRLEGPSAAFDATMLPRGSTRRRLAELIFSDGFDRFSLVITVFACLNLALDAPWLATCGTVAAKAACHDTTAHALVAYINGADAAVTAFFCLEVATKTVCQGVWGSHHGYFRSRWNVLDVTVALTSVFALAIGQQGWVAGAALRSIRSARALRALRGLRLFHTTSLATVLDSLWVMLPPAANALVLVFLFMYVFAIIGLQSFMVGARAN